MAVSSVGGGGSSAAQQLMNSATRSRQMSVKMAETQRDVQKEVGDGLMRNQLRIQQTMEGVQRNAIATMKGGTIDTFA